MTDTVPAPTSAEKLARETADMHYRDAGRGGVWSPPGLSWSLFEFGRNTYYLIIVIYIFAPYFAAQVVGDPVQGQATVAGAMKWAGIVAALTAPFLGALVDQGGKKKPLMAVFLMAIGICSVLLYWSMPAAISPNGGLGVEGTVAVLVIAYVSYTYSEVLHNAMLAQAGRPEVLSHISGAGLALGNAAGVLMFVFFLGAFALPASMGWPFDAPLFGIDASRFEAERLTGPIVAVWMVIFVIPFFLFMPDETRPGSSWRQAVGEFVGIGTQANLITRLRDVVTYVIDLFRAFPEVMRYLLARMLFADGVTALITLGGVYVATFLGWNLVEMIIYAIYASVFAVFGGFFAGWLDARIGARKALIVELTAAQVVLITQLSITPESLFFGLIPAGEPVWNGPAFQTLSDLVYLGLIGLVAICVTAAISSSRFMLVAIAPRERLGQFYGFYAIAGSITVWIGPLLVQVFTTAFDSQRIGMASISILFWAGIALLFTVRHDGFMTRDKQDQA
jgi:MFS transporter, UMF1 family